jgi:hypothetical protein
MTRGLRNPLTWDNLPEFPDDDELGEVVLGKDRAGEFHALATLREIDGMPKIDPFWGGRPKRLVKQYLEADQVAVSPVAKYGVKGKWNDSCTVPA